MRRILLPVMSAMMVITPCVVMAQNPQATTELQRQLQRLGQTYKAEQNANPQSQADIAPPITPPGPGGTVVQSTTVTTPAADGGTPTTQPSIAAQANGMPARPVMDLGVEQQQQLKEMMDRVRSTGVQEAGPGGPAVPKPGVVVTPDIGLSEEAFLSTTRQTVPMSPEQVRTLKDLYIRVQKAAAEDPGVPPKPTSTSKTVDLSPGATPPIVRLQSGFVTSVVFLDASGSPWPIQAYDLGDPKAFNIQWDKKTNTNTLMVQAVTSYKSGNLAVMLKQMSTPIMITLLPGQRAVDYRVDLRMPGLGPNASTYVSTLPGKESPVLLEVLNGIPPQGSVTLKISGCSTCKGWLYNGHLFFRSRMAVLSPGWISTIASADGMHAYEMQSTPVILVADKGKMNTLTVEGF
ncbi:MAG: DotH/IcmK family type IV secretion protein [Pseudomonadota bacterium]|nr:DotH/IcmK family type IV secretion protein [Pseudomonadota bacterium]